MVGLHRLAARFLVCAALTACDDVVPQADLEDASVDAGLCRLAGLCVFIDWVFIEGGSFVMGIDDPRWPQWRAHPVTVPSFFIARYTEIRWLNYDGVQQRRCLQAGRDGGTGWGT
ncbi:MAG: hypothetical protein R3F43_17810 [bacterium]